MKKLHLFAFLVISALSVSCSSDDAPSSNQTFETSFDYTIDDVAVSPTAFQASRSQNSMGVVAMDAEGNSIDFTFDVFGNLGMVRFYPALSGSPSLYSHRDNSGHYFNFELVDIDDVNKTVKVEFSGRLYEENDNLASAFEEVTGSFWIEYVDVTPSIADLEVSANIAGNDWYSTTSYTTNGSEGFSTFIQHQLSDDEYKILLGFDDDAMSPGTYQITPSSTTNFVKLSKYNLETQSYEVFECTGTMEITSNESGALFSIVSGNYSFTAVNPANPSETIEVTNGSFKTNYSW